MYTNPTAVSVHQRLRLIALLISVLSILCAALIFYHDTRAEGADVSRGIVTGRLLMPDSSPLPEGIVIGLAKLPTNRAEQQLIATRSSVADPLYTGTIDTSTGTYQFEDVLYGGYFLTVLPPTGSNLVLETAPFVLVQQSTVTVADQTLSEPQVAGRILGFDGVTPRDGTVLLDAGTGFSTQTTSVNGRFFFSNLPSGTYTVTVTPTEANTGYAPDPTTLTLVENGPTVTLTLTLSQGSLYGYALNPAGQPINGGTTIFATGERDAGRTSIDYSRTDGYWEIPVLEPGTYTITAETAYDIDGTGLALVPIVVEVPLSDPLTLDFIDWSSFNKRVTGTVVDQNGAPVVGAELVASNLASPESTFAYTNFDGSYQFTLPPGEWEIRVSESYDWVTDTTYRGNGQPITVSFSGDTTPQTYTQNFETIYQDGTILGSLVTSDGPPNPEFDYQIQFYNEDFDYYYYTSSYYSESFRFEAKLYPGVNHLQISSYNDYALVKQFYASVELTSGQRVDLGEILLERISPTIEGRVRTQNGDPIVGARIDATNNGYDSTHSVTTDANGGYQLTLGPYDWELTLSDDSYYGTYVNDNQPKLIDLTAGDNLTGVDFVLTEPTKPISGTILTTPNTIDPFNGSGSVSLRTTDYRFDAEGIEGNPYPGPSTDPITPRFETSAFLQSGIFGTHVVPGRFMLNLDLWFGPLQAYIVEHPGILQFTGNDLSTIELNSQPADTKLTANFIDAASGDLLEVDEIGYMIVNAQNGRYVTADHTLDALTKIEMNLFEGEWLIGWEDQSMCEDPFVGCGLSSYIPKPNDVLSVTVESGQPITVGLPLHQVDVTVSGQVIAPFSNSWYPLDITFVGTGELEGFEIDVLTHENGSYTAHMLAGTYKVVAKSSLNGEYAPADLVLTTYPGETITNFDIVFQEASNQLEVEVIALGMNRPGDITLTALTEKENSGGGHGYTSISGSITPQGLNGVGTLTVDVGQTTTTLQGIAATSESSLERWTGSTIVHNPRDPGRVLLILYPDHGFPMGKGDHFSADQPYQFGLDDRFSVNVPAGTFGDEGIINMALKPGYVYPNSAAYAMLGYGYTVEAWQYLFLHDRSDIPFKPSYQQPIEFTLPYQFSIPWEMVSADQIRVAAYSPVKEEWSILTPDALDTEAQTVTIRSADHTRFALVAPQNEIADTPSLTPFDVYIPFVEQ